MTSKARELRRRMSIDPDAPEPAPRPARTPPREIDETPEPEPEPPAPEPTPAPTKRRRRTSTTDEPAWTTALDDPAIDPDRNGYRSFYVSDAVFARFRAAVYWTARRPDATDVPDNMSSGVEAYMEEVAADLERRYNDGAVFRATPDQKRAHRRRQGGMTT
ncbi:hypothetical protein [Actinomycetospora aeridis]|uniref:Centromere-binding protein ParB C-terminal domain-containing protein n=1 Tax=Actinomycetospora aeridis TaxID=3129231 RepID=A0ABU8NCP2_9PSEU